MKKNKVWMLLLPLCFLFLMVQSGYSQCDLTLDIESVDSSCGYCDGYAEVFPWSSNGPFSYQWSDGSNSTAIYNLCPGSYTVMVTDAAGCTATAVVDIYTPSGLAISGYIVNEPSSPGAMDGELSVAVNGGTAPFNYQWDTGQATVSIDGLGEGTYCVTVTDSNGCSAITCISLVALNLLVEIDGPEQLCVNECAQYNAIESGGSQVCYYEWSYQGLTIGNDPVVNFCPPNAGGNYLMLTAFNCSGTLMDTTSLFITVTNNFPLEIVSTSPASCPDNDDNSSCDKTCANSTITYTVPGSQGMDLEWEVSGAQSYEIDNNLVTVTWGNPGVGEISVFSGADGTGALNLNCIQYVKGPNGTAAVEIGGGVPPYSFQWCGGQTSQWVYNMPGGPCSVTVTDAAGVEDVCEVFIQTATLPCQSTPFLSQLILSDPYCGSGSNGSNGSISLVTGGQGSLTYEWNPAVSTLGYAYDLEAGTYCVTITNAIGCDFEECFTLFNDDELFLNTYVISQPDAGGGFGGSASTQAFGGNPPYTYEWYDSNGNIIMDTPTIYDVPAGDYCVIVTDGNGCSIEECVSLFSNSNPNCPLNAYITITNMPSSCYSTDAALLANATPGTPPPGNMEYEWSGSLGNGADKYGLSAGTYCVTITDIDGCSGTDCITLPCNENIPATCSGEGSLCIDIIPEPNATIISVPAAVNGIVELCKGETVLLQNGSTDAENYVWELGDGYSTSAEEVSYAYSESGLYDVLLIARNECFCIDTTSIRILVSDAEVPEILCTGTTCLYTEQTYTTDAACTDFIWQLSANGTIISGGGPNDNFVTVEWGTGPMGEVSLQVSNCSSLYCDQPTVEQIPIIMDGTPIEGPDKICPGDVSIYSLPLWTGTSYNWTVANGGEIKAGQFTNTISVKWDFELDPNDPIWVAAEYDNCFLDCGGQSTKDVAITPEFYLAGSILACENSSSQYMALDALQNNPVSCDWVVTDPNGDVLWTANATSVADISWPLFPGKYAIKANPTNPDDYCNIDYTIYVNVQAAPPALTAISGQNTICPGQYYTYQSVPNQGNVYYNWSVVGGTPTEFTGSAINVQWGFAPPYELTITQVSTTGLACESLPYTMSVDPVSSINLEGPDEICVEETSSYTANSIGNGTYEWEITPSTAGTVLSGAGSDSIAVLWHSVGSATISLSLCGTSENIVVDVAGFPEPVVIHPSILCPGETGTVSATEAYSTYSWLNENGTEVSTSPSPDLTPGYYELEVTNAVGCPGITSFEIDGFPVPEISISNPSFNFFCVLAGIPIPTLYALNTDGGYTYQWYRNGVPLNVFTDTYTPTTSGSYVVEVVDINNCSAFSNAIFLTESCGGGGGGSPLPGTGNCPNVSNVFSNGAECRHGLFENTSVGYLPGSVQWFFGDPASGANNTSTEETPEHFFTRAGFFNVVMLVTSPGGVTCYINDPFEVPLQADFAANHACPGLTTAFEEISTFTPGNSVIAWEWDFGDPASGSNNTSSLEQPGHVYDNIGVYDVTLTVTASTGCTSTVTKSVNVLSPPTISFVAPQNSCEATALSFQSVLGTNVTTTTWDFGDPASGDANSAKSANTYHAFSAPGVYDVELSVKNIYGCTNSFTMPVSVDANTLNGDIDMTTPICEGHNSTATSPPGASSWIWSTDQTTESITTGTAGVYELTITDGFGCTYSPPEAVLDVIANPDGTIKVTEYNEFGQPADCFFDGYILCEGEDVYLSISGAGDYSYVWSSGEIGDEVVYDEVHNNNLTAGTHNFTVTVTDNLSGCTSVEGPYTVIVNPVPTDIQIASSPVGPICEGTEATLSVSNPDSDLTYLWNTGEYGTSIMASTAGEYFVRGISAFGCEGESNTLEIHRSPDANLVPDGCHTHCAPDTICLPEMPDVIYYQWYLDDNPIPAPEGTVADYLPQTSGSYRVNLTDIYGCYAASDAFDLTLLPYDEYALELGACSGNTVSFAGEDLLPGSVTEFHFENQWGCDSMITVTVTEDLVYDFSETLSTCEGTAIEYNGVFYDAGENVDLTYSSFYGCDSIIHLNILGWPVYDLTETYTICADSSIFYNGIELFPGTTTQFPMLTINGCDSLVTVEVLEYPTFNEIVEMSACAGEMVIYEGASYPAGSSEVFSYQTVAGCDSTITLNVSSNPVFSETETFDACEGNPVSYAGVLLNPGTDTLFQFVSQYNCDSTVQVTVNSITVYEEEVTLVACEGSMVTYEGANYPAGTDETFNYTTNQGCDSTIYLTVNALPVYDMQETYIACSGTTMAYAGEELSPGTTTVFSMTTQTGCDSIVTVEVLENLTYSETVELSGCEGEQVTYEGASYPVGTSETFNYLTVAGCDSTILLNVLSNPVFSETETFNACEGNPISYAGVLLNPGTDTLFQFVSQYNCDSTVQVTVNSITVYEEEVTLFTCEGSMVTYEGANYPAGTDETFNYMSSQGCDSVIYLTVNALPVFDMEESYSTCSGTTFSYAGEELSPGTTTVFSMTTETGCDSIVTVEVLENLTYSEIVELSGCEGSQVTYEGVNYPAGSSQTFNYSTVAGCDSIIQLNIGINPVDEMTAALSTCEGSAIEFAGVLLEAGADTLFQLLNQYGCDSTIQVTVTGVAGFEEDLNLSVCEGSTATYNGTTYPIGTDETFNYSSTQGCDSTIYLTVSALPVYDMQETYSTCSGTTIPYAGQELLPGSTTTFSWMSQEGCDSIVTVTVLEDLTYDEIVALNGCEGETVTYEGIDYLAGTTTVFNYTTVAGCDSNIVLTIAALPLSDNEIPLSACSGTTAEYNGDNLPAGTTTEYVFINQNGCDSVVQVIVSELPTSSEEVNLSGCEGTTVLFAGVEYATGTQNNLTYVNQWGCDSIINLNIAALPVAITDITLDVCPGEAVEYNGDLLLGGTVSEFLYVADNGCDSIVIVEVLSYPEFDFELSSSGIACWNTAEGEIIVENIAGGTTPFSFALSNGNFQTDTLFDQLSPGDYTIFVQDGNGCVEEKEVALPEIPPLALAFNAPSLTCEADSILVQAQLLSGYTDSMTYNWQHGVDGAVVPVYDPGLYTVAVTNECETQAFDLEVALGDRIASGYFYIPNAFSPNSDGKNDVFQAYAADDIEVLDYDLRVFDRWGNTLFISEEINNGWDGLYSDKAMNPGVYVWWLKAEVLVCGRQVVEVFEQGDVTILK